jgi:sugar phosphate isomerase/epimerase
MGTLKVGVQVYSVRDYAEKDFKGTMKKIKDMGYDGVELAGLYGLEPSEIKNILSELDLEVMSAHVPFDELINDTNKTIDDYIEIGCKYVAVPFLLEDERPASGNYATVLKNIKRIGEACKDKGVVLTYHNHDFEFVKYENAKYALDYMYETIPSDLLQTELDTCWINVAGEDPVEYIAKYAGRTPVVHIKDFYIDRDAKQSKMYNLVGEEDNEDAIRSSFEFRPVGMGLQDVPDIVKQSIASGAEWIVVEQDLSYDITSLEAIEISRKYLKTIGY